MSQPVPHAPSPTTSWPWPINSAAYDRTPTLTGSEREELERIFTRSHGQLRKPTKRILERLVRPIEEVLGYICASSDDQLAVIRLMCMEMHQRGTSFWAWPLETWLHILGPNSAIFSQRYAWKGLHHPARAYLPLIAYMLEAIPDVWPLIEMFELRRQAQKIFGKAAVTQAVLRLRSVLHSWGYRQKEQCGFAACVSYLLLRNRSPYLEDLTDELLELVNQTCSVKRVQGELFQVSRALSGLGIIARPLPQMRRERPEVSGTDGSVSEQWLSWCRRWRNSEYGTRK